MNKTTPPPRMPAAHIALYGKPESHTEQEFIQLFRRLSEANKNRCIDYLKALASDDQATIDAMKREMEIEQAYLQRTNTRDQLAADLLAGRTPEGLQEAIRAGLENSAGGDA